jgi:competence CoiA-like predicted nuclease
MALKIPVVMHYKSGRITDSTKFTESKYKFRFREFIEKKRREQIRFSKEKYLVCPACLEPVYIRGCIEGSKVVPHFAHYKNNKKCIFENKGGLTLEAIRAIKYNGQKESLLHLRLKNYIIDAIERDGRYGKPKSEKRINITSGTFRQPDVYIDDYKYKIAFEIQLSSTFTKEIVGRYEDLKEEGYNIIWFFRKNKFHPQQMRYAELGIFEPNNYNAFILDESIIDNEFKFICGYNEIFIENGEIKEIWNERTVTLEDLTCAQSGKVFYYNHQKHKIAALNFLKSQSIQNLKNTIASDVEKIFLSKSDTKKHEIHNKYDKFFKDNNIYFNYSEFRHIIVALYTLKHGKIVCTKRSNIVEDLYDALLPLTNLRHKKYGFLLSEAIIFYNFNETANLRDNMRLSDFFNKLEKYKNTFDKDDTEAYDFLKLIFPDLFEWLKQRPYSIIHKL